MARLKRPEEGAWKGNRLKHLSKNPAIKGVVTRFKNDLAKVAKNCNPKDILEMGGGEGFNTIVIHKYLPDVPILSIDLEKEYVEYAKKHHARPNVTYKLQDLYKMDPKKKYDMVMCNEVLEHLTDYHKALEGIFAMSKKWVLLSVPREPWFRMANIARLRYLKRLGNTPGHINNWTKRQFVKLVSKYGKVVHVQTSSFWTIVLLKKD